MQGSAGSGKTTIGLHRIAYLAFADPRRFRPERMLVVVYQRALATYVSRVLPSLDVDGRAGDDLRRLGRCRATRGVALDRRPGLTDETPSLVMRAKSHGAMLKILDDRQAEMAAWCRTLLETELAGKADADSGARRSGTRRAGRSTRGSPRWPSGCATAASIPRRATRSRTPAARCARAPAT